MSRLPIPERDKAPAGSHALLDGVKAQIGSIPNLFRVVANSPAALEGYLSFSKALSRTLTPARREQIALAVAEVNGCDYCLSAHSYFGANFAKLSSSEIALNRNGHASDAHTDAILAFARAVALARGKVGDADLAAIRQAGASDAEIVEIVAHVALNVLTNFVNNVAETDIDFPVVRAAAA
jgi:uncharacterized peroxidase-related enzyme